MGLTSGREHAGVGVLVVAGLVVQQVVAASKDEECGHCVHT